jgi:hypothetical protein
MFKWNRSCKHHVSYRIISHKDQGYLGRNVNQVWDTNFAVTRFGHITLDVAQKADPDGRAV